MKQFYNFVKKEVYHITRDIRTLIVLILIPIVLLVIFGYAIRTEINDAVIGIYNKSNDDISLEISQKILSSGYFILKEYITDEKEIESLFKQSQVKQVIVFEENFGRKFQKEGKASIQLINDASNPNLATILNGYANGIINDYVRDYNVKNNANGLIVSSEVKMLFNPALKSVFRFVPGLIALILMLVSAIMTSISITREKELGNMEILLVSPLKPYIIIIGKVIPYILLSFFNAIIIIVLSYLIFGIEIKGSILLLGFESFLFISTALSLGLLISTVTKTQQVALMISLVGLLMPTMLLSGFIYPVENMPLPLQIISNIIPAKWYLIILKGIMLKGVGIEYFIKETLILVGMTLFFILLSIKKFKIRL
jgi:ABC-2 type transport system permease protein